MKVTNQVNFAIVPEWILYADISPQAVRLYGILNRYADKTRKAKPSRATLKERMRVGSTKTVDRAMDELERIGAITIKARYTERGDQTSNWYVINQVPKGATQMSMGGDADVSSPDDDGSETPVAKPIEAEETTTPLDIDVPPPGDASDETPLDTDVAQNESQFELETPIPPPPSASGARPRSLQTNPRSNGTNPRAVAKRREREALERQIASCEVCGDKGWECTRCAARRRNLELVS